MKKIILIVAITIFVGVSITACKSEKKEIAKVEYVCPMECEGDKTYTDKETKCPVCKMSLVEKKESAEDNHDGHNH